VKVTEGGRHAFLEKKKNADDPICGNRPPISEKDGDKKGKILSNSRKGKTARVTLVGPTQKTNAANGRYNSNRKNRRGIQGKRLRPDQTKGKKGWCALVPM